MSNTSENNPPSSRKPRVKRTNPLTARRFHDPVVLALGELTDFRTQVPVAMKLVQDKVLETFSFTEEDRREVELTNRKGDDPSKFLDKFARRRIQFAFRNRRQTSSFTNARNQNDRPTVYLKNGTALTVSLGVGQWGLTEAGVTRARELAALENAEIKAPPVEQVAEPIVTPVEESAEPLKQETENLPSETPELSPAPPVVRRRRTLGSYQG